MLSDILNLLGLSTTNETAVTLINIIIETVTQRLLLRLEADTLPGELNYIVKEVTVARYNRIGSEGISSHSVEGESITFNDDDFGPYESDIEAYLNAQKGTKKGVVRFL